MEAATTGSDILESCLAGRGIDFDCDKNLTPTYGINYHRPSPDGENQPALVFQVQDAEGWLRGVHRTSLEQDHSGQWSRRSDGTAKAMLGAMTGNHACLYRGETRLLIVTEGIEDRFAALDLANKEALFLQQYLNHLGMHSAYPWFIFNQCSVWAAMSAGGMANLELPPRGNLEFTDILIIADPEDARRKAAQLLGERSGKMGYFA